jgi:hypothetical protein
MNGHETYDLTENVDRLHVGPRHVRPVSDELVLSVAHRTIGDPRSILVSRRDAEELHAWLGRWLAEGWDGVERQCGAEKRMGLWTWKCTRAPHGPTAGDHRGRATSWPSDSLITDRAAYTWSDR